MCNVNALGFPISRPKGPSKVSGFQTGDLIRAQVTKGKKVGIYVGRVAIKMDTQKKERAITSFIPK